MMSDDTVTFYGEKMKQTWFVSLSHKSKGDKKTPELPKLLILNLFGLTKRDKQPHWRNGI